MVARISALVLMAVVFAGGFWYYRWRTANPPQPKTITTEAKSYIQNLPLSEVALKATDSFSGQSVVEVLGKITNKGDRALESVEVSCVFYDPFGQVVLRERSAIVRTKSGGLKPGETKPFRLAFDNLPPSWNQSLPQLVIASIQFG